MRPERTAPARPPRGQIALSCTLRRRVGAPILGETLDLGPDGMRVTCKRPLAIDEMLEFELPNLPMRVTGCARVLRQDRRDVYALRFERLPEPVYRRLQALAVAGPRPGGAV